MKQENSQCPSPFVHNTKVVDTIYLYNSYFCKLQQFTSISLSRYSNTLNEARDMSYLVLALSQRIVYDITP